MQALPGGDSFPAEGWADDYLPSVEALEREARLRKVQEIAKRHPLGAACQMVKISRATYKRWLRQYRAEGLRGLEPKYKNGGRPRVLEVTPEMEADIAELYLRSNRNGSSGSMTMVAHVLAGKYPELKAALSRSKSKHVLPVAFREACQRVAGLVGVHRGGKRALRSATYAPGLMRMSEDKTRRLYGGEQLSWDDGTINFGVCVPWPYGGDPCSDRWNYKVGRFQLILCHDDATGFVPSWTYVVRPAQSYRGAETGGAILRTMRDTVQPDRIVIEGGVWQSEHVLGLLEAVGVRWVDAKGRPQCKLVENYFNRLWTRLSMETRGQVGRFRGEEKEMSDLYCACQRGDKNPAEHFPLLSEALGAIERSILWLNEYPVESEYGSWVPVKRFQADLESTGRGPLSRELGYLASPVVETRKVRRMQIEVTAEGAFGLRQKYYFGHEDLYQYEGRDVRVYFDPLGEMPVKAAVVLLNPWAGKRSGDVICIAEDKAPPLDGTPGTGVEIAKMTRAAMQRHYTAVMPNRQTGRPEVIRRESEARGAGMRAEVISGGDPAPGAAPPTAAPMGGERAKAVRREVCAPGARGERGMPASFAVRGGLSQEEDPTDYDALAARLDAEEARMRQEGLLV